MPNAQTTLIIWKWRLALIMSSVSKLEIGIACSYHSIDSLLKVLTLKLCNFCLFIGPGLAKNSANEEQLSASVKDSIIIYEPNTEDGSGLSSKARNSLVFRSLSASYSFFSRSSYACNCLMSSFDLSSAAAFYCLVFSTRTKSAKLGRTLWFCS